MPEATLATGLRSVAFVGLALLTGCARAPAADRPDAGRDAHQEEAVAAPSSEVLALLPDGTEKRKLILDCTACHQMDAVRVFPEGEPRSEDEWREIVERMRELGGAGTEAPLISPDRDPSSTAAWLATNLRAPPGPRSAPPVPPGAEITPYRFPVADDLPHDLAVDADGGVVVTGMFSHRMVRLDPRDESWTTVAIPVEQSNPRAVEIDETGDWWVLLGAPGKIARYRVADEAWDTWDIGMYGHSLRLDGRGRAWFNGHFTRHPSIFGWLHIASGEVSTVEVPDRPVPEADHPMPYGLRVADDGRVWGTELRGGRLFEYRPETDTVIVRRMPDRHVGPRRPAVAGDGRVWIPEYAANRLTVFDPVSEGFRSFELPISDALPYVAEVDRRTGQVWLGTAAADVVLSFDPEREEFTTYPMPTEGALIRHLVVDEGRGDVWAAYGAFPGIEPRIVRIRPAPVGR